MVCVTAMYDTLCVIQLCLFSDVVTVLERWDNSVLWICFGDLFRPICEVCVTLCVLRTMTPLHVAAMFHRGLLWYKKFFFARGS